ncbi:Txe/YoeB family addiction module toxin [Thioflexithrix psekupsensis]|uniref:Putative mRNA interferase YoeB n=1 Tax=Thioflexithrix psekupsensis TaxID=1570016 RepID=A0A251XAX8_9GAMM|nr:Txe/YoeB family addiction module toxin [Thioflexithrix psekupsensis]OUD15226.1 Txe/YoeB family addiction module toxin [Thioflexithrix psekupsensis]
MRDIVFQQSTWECYETLRERDKKLHKKLRDILKEMQRSDDLTQGLGKPEALRHELTGKYSRRLSDKERLIDSFDDELIYIYAIGGHYD